MVTTTNIFTVCKYFSLYPARAAGASRDSRGWCTSCPEEGGGQGTQEDEKQGDNTFSIQLQLVYIEIDKAEERKLEATLLFIFGILVSCPHQRGIGKKCVLPSVSGKHYGPRYLDPVNIPGQVQVSCSGLSISDGAITILTPCSWYKLMQANYNKILGIQSSKQRAKSKLRSVKNLKSDVSRDRPVSDVWHRPQSLHSHSKAAMTLYG